MSCSVNLVPGARLHAQARARRRTGWLILGATGALLVGAAWGVQHIAVRGLDRLSDHVAALEVQRAEVQRRLLMSKGERDELIEQLRVAAAARRPQPWARRLTALAREAPAGVFLTEIVVTTPEVAPKRREPAAPPEGAPDTPSEQNIQVARLLGYAVDHGALIQLLNTLQGFPDWEQVELVRATLEPYRGGLAVAFQFDCRTQEGRP